MIDQSSATDLAAAAIAIAGHADAGGTLWCIAPEWPEHAHHVAVEFVHPVIMGKRALPAMAVSELVPGTLADAAIVIGPSSSTACSAAVKTARDQGVTTIWIATGGRPSVGVDHLVVVDDPKGTARHDGSGVLRYHLLWELAQLCLEHAALLRSDGTTGAADFLYPFLGESDGARDVDLAASAIDKADTSAALAESTIATNEATLTAAAEQVEARLAAGGRVLTIGNGGSATDAAGLAALFTDPPWGQPRPAHCLADDPAVLTALGNDIGFDAVFARQLSATGRRQDVVVGFSTSGTSRNVLRAFDEAKRTGMLTIGTAGYGGGDFGSSAHVDHCLAIDSDSVHRIQESQAALGFELWSTLG